MTEVPTIKKPVHWFEEQINELVSMTGTSVMKELIRNLTKSVHYEL